MNRAALLRAFALVAAFFLAGSAGTHAVELFVSGRTPTAVVWLVVAVSLLAVGTLMQIAFMRSARG